MDNPVRLLACALLLAACSPAQPAAPLPSPAPRSGGVAVVADWEAPAGYDAAGAGTEPGLRLAALVYSALWDLDGDGRPVPRLAGTIPAARWEAGALTLDVRLREGLRWSDGTPLGAADVVRAVQARPGPVAGAEQVGPLEVKLRLAPGLDAPLWAGAGLRPLPPAGPGSAYSGPFRPVSAPPGEFRVERNPYYFGPPALLDGIVFRSPPSHDALVAAVAAGAVDVAFHFGPGDLQSLAGMTGSAPVEALSSRLLALNPNHASGPWSGGDERLLDALSLAVDREALAAGNAASAAPFPQVRPEAPARDLPKAIAGLEADGWQTGPGGLRVKTGRPLAFRVTAPCEDSWSATALERLRLQWREAGAGVEAACEPRAAMLSEGAAGSFQMQLYTLDFGWEPGAWAPLAEPGTENWNRCQDPVLAARLGARDYVAAAAQWAAYACTITLYQERHVVQVRHDLHGFDPGRGPSPETWNAARWWLDPKPTVH